MSTLKNFSEAIGGTPLIRLNGVSKATGCEIYGKAEFMNPGGSVKDRAARAILDDAEAGGRLQPGGTVVEGTAGNTGISLAHLCHARGYRLILVMPDNQSQEKFETLGALGVEVRKVRAVPYANANHYQKVACRLAEETPGAIWANQFDNTANRDGHYATTGAEIWRDAGPRLDAFVAATGTGGTLGGVSRLLKDKRPGVRIVLADPQGSALYRWIKDGELRAEGPGSITEGIGIGRVTANLLEAPIDDAVHVPDSSAVSAVYRLLNEDGLFLGGASGVNVAGAAQVARQLGPGHTIVTVLCDSGHKYASRLFSPAWLAQKGLDAFAREPESW